MMKKHTQSGVIFAWDGVVVDSSAAHEHSWEHLAAERNLLLPENAAKRAFGRRDEEIIQNILNWSDVPEEIHELAERRSEIFRKIVTEEGVEPLPGARRLLEDLKQRGIPCAVVSAIPRETMELQLKIMDLCSAFAGIVSGENSVAGQTLSEIFLRAANIIAREPANTVVFESTVAGIVAARDAGFKVVAVASTNPVDLLQRANAHYVAEKLTDTGVGLVDALTRG